MEGYMRLFQVLADWETKGKPKGATYSIGFGKERRPIEELLAAEMMDKSIRDDYWYYDPPEQWIDIDPVLATLKLQSGVTVRCKPKRNNLDDAFDEWCSIDGLLLSDIFKFDFQYLSNV